MEYYSLTDIGLYRDKNQDSYMTLFNKYNDFLVLVCDGIGGGKAGDVASGEVIKHFSEVFPKSGPFEDLIMAKEYITYHVNIANKKVYELAHEYKEYEGMGTTLTGLLFTKDGVLSINVGDSRVYGFLDNKLFHLTTDHSLVNQMLENGEITYEESINHPKKHYLVKAVGIFENVDPDVHKVKDMEYFLVCSDGLHGYVNDDDILKIVTNTNGNIEEKANELLKKALLNGGYDNITLSLIKR